MSAWSLLTSWPPISTQLPSIGKVGPREDPPAEPPARLVEPGGIPAVQRPQRDQPGEPAADDGDLAGAARRRTRAAARRAGRGGHQP
jgi:hypothetical protein